MDSQNQQASNILTTINKLYDENERENALKELSEQVCDEGLRALYLYNSFGVMSILQEEILSVYKYLFTDSISQQEEMRVCNALTILRSIVSVEEYAIQVMNSNLLYFLTPLVQTTSSHFNNIRKVCLAIIIEITVRKNNDSISLGIINQGILRSCLSIYDNVEEKEKESILVILSNTICKMSIIQQIIANPATRNYVKLFLIHCGSLVVDKDNMQNKIWNDIMNYLSNSGFPDIANEIKYKIRAVI